VGEADRLATQASGFAGDSPGLLACRAEVAAARGDVAEAVTLLRHAAGLLPPNNPQRAVFLQRAKVLGDTNGEL